MIVGTADAAKILNISTARLRVLLIAGRVQGAYKTGKRKVGGVGFRPAKLFKRNLVNAFIQWQTHCSTM